MTIITKPNKKHFLVMNELSILHDGLLENTRRHVATHGELEKNDRGREKLDSNQ